MKHFLLIVLMNSVLIGCVTAGGTMQPVLNKQAFPGFDFSQGESNKPQNLSGYQYQTIQGNSIDIHNCKQASDMNVENIAEFEYFRFQQLLLSCRAVEKFGHARASEVSYFPAVPGPEFYQDLPAATAPLLSKSDLATRKGKSFKAYDKSTQVNIENKFGAKLLSDDDEIYITLLARGDFTGDGAEDLLVKSEWYARKAFGKHLDLLILDRPGEKQAINIEWRMNAIR